MAKVPSLREESCPKDFRSSNWSLWIYFWLLFVGILLASFGVSWPSGVFTLDTFDFSPACVIEKCCLQWTLCEECMRAESCCTYAIEPRILELKCYHQGLDPRFSSGSPWAICSLWHPVMWPAEDLRNQNIFYMQLWVQSRPVECYISLTFIGQPAVHTW